MFCHIIIIIIIIIIILIIIIIIIIIIIKPRNVDAYSFERALVFVRPVRC